MRKAIVLFLACLSGGWLMANHWTPVGAPYEENMALTCVVHVDGVEQASDMLEVGVFCGDECRGSQMAAYFEPEQRYVYLITVFGEVGDTLTFRLFDHELNEELDLTPPDALTFTIDGYGTLPAPQVLNFMATSAEITQMTTLSVGWNWWSGYIELSGVDGLGMLQEALGSNGVMIKSQNDGFNSYLEGFGWYGALSTISNEAMYQIRAGSGCTIELTGLDIHPADHPITLGTGWNWIGFPSTVSMSVEEAFSSITPQNGDMLKSQNDGFASYLEGFGWYGQLTTLTPGMGLMYKSNNSQTVTLTLPTVVEGRGR